MSGARKRAALVSMGTFDEETARAMASALTSREEIAATVERLFVGERNDQPTEWWHLYVPARDAKAVSLWISGFRAGSEHRLIDTYRSTHGISYAEAARRLGYGASQPKSAT